MSFQNDFDKKQDDVNRSTQGKVKTDGLQSFIWIVYLIGICLGLVLAPGAELHNSLLLKFLKDASSLHGYVEKYAKARVLAGKLVAVGNYSNISEEVGVHNTCVIGGVFLQMDGQRKGGTEL